METDISPEALLRTLAAPVFEELLADEEMSEFIVSFPSASETHLRISVGGESFEFWVRTTGQTAEPRSALQHRLAEELSDWIAETTFGWGEMRRHSF